nr:immunoglobulin light chain junction region [Macaca mulatta]
DYYCQVYDSSANVF